MSYPRISDLPDFVGKYEAIALQKLGLQISKQEVGPDKSSADYVLFGLIHRLVKEGILK